MANVNEQLASLAETALAPGEEILASVRVNYNGTLQPNTTSLNVALDPTAVPDPDALVAFPSAQQMGLVLTGGRLLVWALGMTRKPKNYIGEVPLSAVSEVHAGEVSFGPLTRLVMKSGAAVDLEIPRNEPECDQFIAQLKHLVGEGSDSRTSQADEPG